jgi:hypothetical protein
MCKAAPIKEDMQPNNLLGWEMALPNSLRSKQKADFLFLKR